MGRQSPIARRRPWSIIIPIQRHIKYNPEPALSPAAFYHNGWLNWYNPHPTGNTRDPVSVDSNMAVLKTRTRPEPWSRPAAQAKYGWLLPVYALEWGLRWLAYLLSGWAFLEVLEYLGTLSLLVAAVSYFAESKDRIKQKHYQAWQVINSAQGKGGSGGRIDALEELHRDDVPLVGVDVSDAFLQGVDLNGANLLRANLRAADIREGSFAGSQLEYADLTSTNLRHADLRGG